MESLLHRAIKLWGREKQWRQVQEECAELIAAINRAERGRYDAEEQRLEEVVDVWIMVNQARLLVGEAYFQLALQRKLARLETRVYASEQKQKEPVL
jgi:hypothetical protein